MTKLALRFYIDDRRRATPPARPAQSSPSTRSLKPRKKRHKMIKIRVFASNKRGKKGKRIAELRKRVEKSFWGEMKLPVSLMNSLRGSKAGEAGETGEAGKDGDGEETQDAEGVVGSTAVVGSSGVMGRKDSQGSMSDQTLYLRLECKRCTRRTQLVVSNPKPCRRRKRRRRKGKKRRKRRKTRRTKKTKLCFIKHLENKRIEPFIMIEEKTQ